MSLNVLRWGVLTTGVVYGFTHNRTLQARAAESARHEAFARRERLIADARAEYARLHPRPAPAAGAPTTDVDSPDFDPVKLIDWAVHHLPAA